MVKLGSSHASVYSDFLITQVLRLVKDSIAIIRCVLIWFWRSIPCEEQLSIVAESGNLERDGILLLILFKCASYVSKSSFNFNNEYQFYIIWMENCYLKILKNIFVRQKTCTCCHRSYKFIHTAIIITHSMYVYRKFPFIFFNHLFRVPALSNLS